VFKKKKRKEPGAPPRCEGCGEAGMRRAAFCSVCEEGHRACLQDALEEGVLLQAATTVRSLRQDSSTLPALSTLSWPLGPPMHCPKSQAPYLHDYSQQQCGSRCFLALLHYRANCCVRLCTAHLHVHTHGIQAGHAGTLAAPQPEREGGRERERERERARLRERD
jgi:hypothetical protein